MLIGNNERVKENQGSKIQIGQDDIPIVNKVRNLGTYFDSEMKMSHQISALCKSLNFELKKISHIRQYISVETCKKLVVALLFSRLDYCNSLLVNLPDTAIKRLQTIQNHASRLVLRKYKFESATPLLETLHWLPVKKRAEYKAACLVYKCLAGEGPAYLSDRLKIYTPARALRSSRDKTKLVEKRTRTKLGERSFSSFGPKI